YFALRHRIRRDDSSPDPGCGANNRGAAGHASAGDHRRRCSDGLVRGSGSRYGGRVSDQRAGPQRGRKWRSAGSRAGRYRHDSDHDADGPEVTDSPGWTYTPDLSNTGQMGPQGKRDQLDDFVEARYNPNRKTEDFRKFDESAPAGVREFYRENHA